MNYTKEQIIDIAKQVMQDLDGRFYRESSVDIKPFFYKRKLYKDGISKNDTIDSWLLSIKTIGDNEDSLYISDETGEPIFYQNFNTFVFDIVKNSNGKYELKDIDLR
ncbi:MAG: hypothetical protein WBA16_10105 [Nonlabens sp.]